MPIKSGSYCSLSRGCRWTHARQPERKKKTQMSDNSCKLFVQSSLQSTGPDVELDA